MKPTERHVAVCGHAQHGKSTIAGRLLYEFGAVSQFELQELRQEAEERNRGIGRRGFNEFSMMFLKSRGVTFSKGGHPTDPSRTGFPERGSAIIGEDRRITLIDTPGYSRFLSNIIYGIYLSDLAILVVEAAAGVERGTRDVTRILASFNIPLAAILVSKMDVVKYSQDRFNEVSNEIENSIVPILNRFQRDDRSIPIIPVSALSGVGFRGPNGEMDWYRGIDTLQALERAERVAAPGTVEGVRFAVEGGKEVFSPPGIGTVLVGVLETGVLRTGMDLMIEPASSIRGEAIKIRTRSLQRARTVAEKRGESANEIAAREIVAVAITELSAPDARRHVRHGAVLGAPQAPPSVASEIDGEVVFFEPDTIYSGKQYPINANASDGLAHIVSIRSGPEDLNLESDKYSANAGEVMLARLRFERPLCVESAPEYQRLTRFLLRERDRIVACGRCVNVVR